MFMSLMGPKVSIIVPIFRAEKYLSLCIESILKQSYKNIEIILIDDGSPDQSGEICDYYSAVNSNIIVIHQDNKGVSYARNQGILIAKGDYIVFVDADDTIDRRAIEYLIAPVFSDKADLVIGGYSSFDDGRLIKNHSVKEETILKNDLVYKAFLHGLMGNTACAKLYKTETVISKNVMFREDLRLGEDYCFVIDYIKNVKTVTILNKSIYNYRINTDEKIRYYKKQDCVFQWNNEMKLFRHLCRAFKQNGVYDKYESELGLNLAKWVRIYINNMQVYHGDKSDIISQLKRFEKSREYKLIKRIDIYKIIDLKDKIVILLCKSKQWIILYDLLYFKNKIKRKIRV